MSDNDLVEMMRELVIELSHALKKAEEQHDKLLEQSYLIENMIAVSGGYLWRKDRDLRYLYCDKSFCVRFLDLKDNCNIEGFTDKALVNDFVRRTGRRMRMDKISEITDAHCMINKNRCRYVVADYVGDDIVVLDLVKTPLFLNDEFDGLVGFAIDKTGTCNDVFNNLEALINKNQAEPLFVKNRECAVYYIYEQKQECLLNMP